MYGCNRYRSHGWPEESMKPLHRMRAQQELLKVLFLETSATSFSAERLPNVHQTIEFSRQRSLKITGLLGYRMDKGQNLGVKGQTF